MTANHEQNGRTAIVSIVAKEFRFRNYQWRAPNVPGDLLIIYEK
jgi:hypothetical protein